MCEFIGFLFKELMCFIQVFFSRISFIRFFPVIRFFRWPLEKRITGVSLYIKKDKMLDRSDL